MRRPRHALALLVLCAGCVAAPPTEPCIGAEVAVPLRYADPSGVEQLDLLFVIDHASVPDEVADELVLETTRLLSILASGSFRGSPFWPIRDVQVGVVSSDLGAGAAPISRCTNLGDDGLLVACPGDYTHALVRGGDASALRCALTVERECGVSQPLESMLKAISTAQQRWGRELVTFADADGTPEAMTGHGDGANAGFVRSGHLAVVIVTAADDCSLADTRSLRGEPPIETEDAGTWCLSHPELLHDVSRYTEGLLGLAPYPWVSVIAGVPEDGARSTGISCEAEGLRTTAPSRLFAFAEQSEIPVDVTSICMDDLRPAFDRLLTRIAAVQCPMGCLRRAMRASDTGTIDCEVLELLPEHGEHTSCAMLPGRELVETIESDVRGPRELCRLTQLSAAVGERGDEPGWWYDETSSALGELCAGWIARVAVSESAPMPAGAELQMRCESTALVPLPDALCDGDEARSCEVGMPCDPTGTDLCRGPGAGSGTELTCDALERVCAPPCVSDDDCARPGLEGQRCDLRTIGSIADARSLAVDRGRRDLPRGVCVRPACR